MRVRQNILAPIIKAKLCRMIFDATPKQAHHEQMSQVISYVEIDFDGRRNIV